MPFLVQHRKLLLKLAIVLAGRVSASNELLRRLDLVGAQLLRVDRAGLVPIARGLVVVRMVVRGALSLTLGAITQFLLGRSVLVDVLLFEVHELDAYVLWTVRVRTLSLRMTASFAGLLSCPRTSALESPKSLRKCLRCVFPMVLFARHR